MKITFDRSTNSFRAVQGIFKALSILLLVVFSAFNDALSQESLSKSEQSFAITYSQFASLSPELQPEARVYSHLEYLLNEGKTDSLLQISTRYLEQSLKNNDLPTAVYIEWIIGRAVGRSGKQAQMFDHFFRALNLAEQMQNKYWQGFIEMAIGSMYIVSNVNERAEYFLMRSLKIARSIGDSTLVANILSSIGEIQGKRKQYSSMIQYLQEGLVTLPKNTTPTPYQYFFIGNIYGKIGWAFLYMREYDSADVNLRRGIGIFQHSPNKRFVPDSYLALSQVYIAQKNYVRAEQVLDSVEMYVKKMNLNILRFGIYRVRAILADSLGNFKQAYSYFRLYHEERNTVFSNESAVQSEAMKNEFSQRLEAQQRVYSYALFGAVILAMCIVIATLWHFYRVKKRAEQELISQREQIANLAFTIQNTNLQLEQRNHSLDNLNKLKNTFLGIATHDLRNPLTQIMLSGGMIQQYVQAQPASALNTSSIVHHSERILHSAEFMNQIIQDLLDVNKLESGTMIAQIREVSLGLMISAIAQHETSAAKKQIRLECAQTLEELQTMIVYADERALMQVLDNLLSNAVKYSPLGKTVWIRVFITREDSATALHESKVCEWACIEVHDEGQGLSEDDKTRVFERFAKLSAKPTAGESSTGLGLAISKELVKQMNGEIGVRSTFGQGATFFIRLPLVRTAMS
jgi:signal transduction histidine kinase